MKCFLLNVGRVAYLPFLARTLRLWVDSLNYFQRLAVIMTMIALVPLLVEDEFGAGGPPFGNKLVFGELPMVTFIGDANGKPMFATPLTNLWLVTQIAMETPGMALLWILAAPVRDESAVSDMLHVGNSGSTGHSGIAKRLAFEYCRRRRAVGEVPNHGPYMQCLTLVASNPCEPSSGRVMLCQLQRRFGVPNATWQLPIRS